MQGNLRPDQLQHLLEAVTEDQRRLITTYNQPYRTDDARAQARQTLAASVERAQAALGQLRGTRDPQLQHVMSKLTVQTELANDSLKHPETLRR